MCVCRPSLCVGQVSVGAKLLGAKCVCGPIVCVGQVFVWAKSDQKESKVGDPSNFPHFSSQLLIDLDIFVLILIIRT